jgi:cell division inhibitor SulA
MRQLSFEVCPQAVPLSSAQNAAEGSAITGSMTEIIVSESSALQPFQLLPALALCNDQQRWLMWLSPNQAMNKQWLTRAGLDNSPVLHMNINAQNQLSLCLKALSAARSHLIVEWSGCLTAQERAALRTCAEQNGTYLFVVRGE